MNDQNQSRADALTEALIRKIATQYCEYDAGGRTYNILRYECEADFFNCVRELLSAFPANQPAAAPIVGEVAQWQCRLKDRSSPVVDGWMNIKPDGAKTLLEKYDQIYEVRALYERHQPAPSPAGERAASIGAHLWMPAEIPEPIEVPQDFGERKAYAFKEPQAGEHDPWYVVLPNTATLKLGYHADDAIDKAHAEFIASAINRAIAPRAASANETGAKGANDVTLDRRDLFDFARGAIKSALEDYKAGEGMAPCWYWQEATNRAEALLEALDTKSPYIGSPAMAPEAVDWRELSRRLYVELFNCDQQMRSTRDEEGEPHWTQSAVVRDVLADAKAALDLPIGSLGALFAIQRGFGAQEAMAAEAVAIPAGWKLVPIEPTVSMLVDGFESWPDPIFSTPEEWGAFEKMTGCQQATHKARLCYSAMLAAAPRPAQADARVGLTDSDVFTLIGHAELLRGRGETDMPTWCMGLAHRIAAGIDHSLALRVEALATKHEQTAAHPGQPEPRAEVTNTAEAAFEAFAARYDQESNEWLDMDAQQTFIHGWNAARTGASS